MKPFRSAALVLSLLFATGTAWAATLPFPAGMIAVPLAVVTNDRDSSVSRLELMVDRQSTVRGIYLKTSAHAGEKAPADSGRMYPLAKIETPKGVVLGQGQGVKAIFLRGRIASHDGQGSLVIRYLSNGLFKHYRECRVDLQRVAPGDWRLVNAYDGRPIRRIRVQTWALGISTVANVCPDTRTG